MNFFFHFFERRLEEFQPIFSPSQAVEGSHHRDGIEVGIERRRGMLSQRLDLCPKFAGFTGEGDNPLEFGPVEFLSRKPLAYFYDLFQLMYDILDIFF